MMMDAEKRLNCPMRHENGNCLPMGGFCTAVNDPICEAMHNAYRHGADAVPVVWCKDCKEYSCSSWFCRLNGTRFTPDDFCSYGERREGE